MKLNLTILGLCLLGLLISGSVAYHENKKLKMEAKTEVDPKVEEVAKANEPAVKINIKRKNEKPLMKGGGGVKKK